MLHLCIFPTISALQTFIFLSSVRQCRPCHFVVFNANLDTDLMLGAENTSYSLAILLSPVLSHSGIHLGFVLISYSHSQGQAKPCPMYLIALE